MEIGSDVSSAIITAVIGGLMSGVFVALLNHLLTRRRNEAEIMEMEANTEKTRLEIDQLKSDIDEVRTRVRVIDRLRLDSKSSVVLKEEQNVLGARHEQEK
jgi:phosphate/sulfate permease